MECLESIIGITNTDCECIIEWLTAEEITKIRESKSGLYLDELEGGVNLSAISQIDACKDFASMSLRARDTAIKKLEADVLVALANKYKSAKGAYSGSIGRPSYTRNLPVDKRYQYLRLRPAGQSDAVIKLSGFRLIVDRVADITVKIIEVVSGSGQGQEIFSTDITTSASAYTSIPLGAASLELPLMRDGQSLDYYFVWDKGATGANPKDLKIDCNCGLSGNGFTKFVIAEGGSTEDIDNLNPKSKDSFSNGITLDVEIKCMTGNLICREYSNDNAISITMAYAVMYKAGELLIEFMMSTGEVNRYTMMNREYLWGKRSHFKKEYEGRIAWLGQTIDVSSSDCFICRDNKMMKAGIFS